MNTCKNCKYFKEHFKEHSNYDEDGISQKSTFSKTDFGECTSNKIIYGHPDYWRVLDKNWNPMPLTTDILCYQDNENYGAICLVGRDFGCIHFEPKDNK